MQFRFIQLFFIFSVIFLSAKTNRPFYASDGWVEISKTGVINSKTPFFKYQGGQKLAQQLPHTPRISAGKNGFDFVRLGIQKEEKFGFVFPIGNGKILYRNPTGKTLKWSEQTAYDISKSISTKKKLDPLIPKYEGSIVEGKVADFLQNEGIDIQGFGISVIRGAGSTAGDLDIVLNDFLIEVKKSYSGWNGKRTQMNKYLNINEDDYLNPYGKKVVLYFDEPISELQKAEIKLNVPSGVIIVNSLQELKTIVQL